MVEYKEREMQWFIYSVGVIIVIAIPMFIIGISIESAITGNIYDLSNWGESQFGRLIGGIIVGIIFVCSLIYFRWKLWYVNPKKEREKILREEKQYRSEKEREMLEKIKEIMKVSTRIKLSMLRNILDTDKKTVDNKVFEWAKNYGFTIDGDYLIINRDTVSDFIDALDKEFVLWAKKEKIKSNKIEMKSPYEIYDEEE